MREVKLILDFYRPLEFGVRQCIDRIAINDPARPKSTTDQLQKKVLKHLRQCFEIEDIE